MSYLDKVRFYEELSLNAHPSIKTQVYDGWLLRFADGYTNRANSVNILYGSGELSLDEKISRCEKIYAAEGLPTVYKITPLSYDIDGKLEEKGYEKVTPTNVMDKSLKDFDIPHIKADIRVGISAEWQENYFRMSKLAGTPKEQSARTVQKNIQQKVLSASLSEGGVVKACGICAIERGYVGIYDILTEEHSRGKGYGLAICASLLEGAREAGAENAYLQVVANNAPALALYNKLGYEYCYQYWYRVKKAAE